MSMMKTFSLSTWFLKKVMATSAHMTEHLKFTITSDGQFLKMDTAVSEKHKMIPGMIMHIHSASRTSLTEDQ